MNSSGPEIIYSDNHLLVLNKPAGLLTQDSGSGRANLEDLARDLVRRQKGKNGAVFLHCVHRIDRVVSGLVLFARTSKALARLQAPAGRRSMEKTYCAVVEGRMPESVGTLAHWLTHGDHIAQVVPESSGQGKKSLLHYRVLQSTPGGQCLEIRLETGRYHQIRAQLAAVGCPIVGDARYGSTRHLEDGVIALHHGRMRILHPVQGVPMTFIAPTSSSLIPFRDLPDFSICLSLGEAIPA